MRLPSLRHQTFFQSMRFTPTEMRTQGLAILEDAFAPVADAFHAQKLLDFMDDK
jgi:hypothetical protein